MLNLFQHLTIDEIVGQACNDIKSEISKILKNILYEKDF